MDQTQPFPPGLPANERLAHLTRRAARGYSRALQIRLAEHGISFGQWAFLRILWAEDGLSQRELADRAGLTEPTTHTALQRLEGLGLVSRRNLPGNRRRQHVFLSPEGHRLRAVLEPLAIEVNRAATRGLGEEEESTLRRCLLIIIGNLARDEAAMQAEGQRMPATRTAAES
ncbi:MAG: MarR family transcriptional regulator [Rhodobacteraceae bacterium]|nr:MarR family transcriptional regulator [Paracoccaceae bacterium]